MRNEDFIKQRLLNECQGLLDVQFYFPVFFLISQGIETLGAFLDKKPLAAKAQSKKRFHLAIYQLFDHQYQELSHNDWLYKQLRCHTSHLTTPGAYISLASQKENRGYHLQLLNGKRLFIIEDLASDFNKACMKVIDLLEREELKQKPMALIEIKGSN
tara:strand:- start:343 stop:816 length:474 start_codon:yes stop_codon:yes gene_type:complete